MALVMIERPRLHYLMSRYLVVGDYVSRTDQAFSIVSKVEVDRHFVKVWFADGGVWTGGDNIPFPIAANKEDAAAWNLQLSQLDPAQRAELERTDES